MAQSQICLFVKGAQQINRGFPLDPPALSYISGPTYLGLDPSRTVGANIPNWKERIRNKQSATTSLVATRVETEGAESTFRVKRTDKSTFAGLTDYSVRIVVGTKGIGLGSLADPATLSLTTVDNQAIIRLHDSIAEAYRPFQGGVFLGEMSDLIRMIRQPGLSLRRGFDSYLRSVRERVRASRNPGRQRKKTKPGTKQPRRRSVDQIAADTWLEYQFGWKQAVRDIDAARRAAANLRNRELSVPVSGFAKTIARGEPVLQNVLYLGVARYRRVLQLEQEVSVKYHGQIGLDVDNIIATANRSFGLDFASFVPTAWNLIPYSFVVDYFLNVGDLLQALSNLTVKVLWLEKGTKQVTRQSGLPISVTASKNTNTVSSSVEMDNAPFYYQKVRVSREAVGLPIPALQLSGLHSRTRFINLAALVSSGRRTSYAIRGR